MFKFFSSLLSYDSSAHSIINICIKDLNLSDINKQRLVAKKLAKLALYPESNANKMTVREQQGISALVAVLGSDDDLLKKKHMSPMF